MSTPYIIVCTTFDNQEEAEKITQMLLEKRLVSCCQISHIESAYHWKGEIKRAKEVKAEMKTKRELFPQIAAIITDEHSYEVPQIIAYEILDGSAPFLQWIGAETLQLNDQSLKPTPNKA